MMVLQGGGWLAQMFSVGLNTTHVLLVSQSTWYHNEWTRHNEQRAKQLSGTT